MVDRRSAKFGSFIDVDISLESDEIGSRFSALGMFDDSERFTWPLSAQSMLDALFVFCRRCALGRMLTPVLSS